MPAALIVGSALLALGFGWFLHSTHREVTQWQERQSTRRSALVEALLAHKGRVLVLTRPETGREVIGRIVAVTPDGTVTIDVRRPQWTPEGHTYPGDPPTANDLRTEEIDEDAFYSFSE